MTVRHDREPRAKLVVAGIIVLAHGARSCTVLVIGS
jgi:hypothetical protein